MKNYGLCRKCFHEDFLYRYAKTRAKILSILPGRNKKLWKRNYEDIFDNYYRIGDHDNSLPENHFMNLRTIITADLVHREDIKELQNGIRHLLKTRRTNRFFNFHTDGLDEICNRLEKMDSTLLSWYEKVDCGIFEFKGHRLESTIDYFTVSICNIDSAYLALEFSLYLTDEKKNELDKLIKCNYHEDRGYATSTLTARKNRIGSFQNYSVIHYNDDALKADKIYEFISRIEWECVLLPVRAGLYRASPNQFFLHPHENVSRNDGLMVVLYIILRDNAVVLHPGLVQEIGGIGFLQESVADVFLIAENLVDGAGVPFGFASARQDAISLQTSGDLVHAVPFQIFPVNAFNRFSLGRIND